jgi:hypothetical protein
MRRDGDRHASGANPCDLQGELQPTSFSAATVLGFPKSKTTNTVGNRSTGPV